MLEQQLWGFSSKIYESLKLASYFHAVPKYKMYGAKQLSTDVFINWNLRKGTTFVLTEI
jgi:hypothetical protein